jgi:hypothetical protein
MGVRPWTEQEIESLIRAAAIRDVETFERTAAATGVRLTLAQYADIERNAEFSPAHVLVTIGQAIVDGIGVREERAFMRLRVCLCVARDGMLVVAIGRGSNVGAPLAAIWKELKPWYRDLSRNDQTITAWLAKSNAPRVAIELGTPELRNNTLVDGCRHPLRLALYIERSGGPSKSSAARTLSTHHWMSGSKSNPPGYQ